ncbi:MAG: DUF4012 domain-containing protein [Candidatus Shapirobacteria bacterium]
MSNGLPVAIIWGIDNFVAKRLVEKLAEKDIKVIGVGESSINLDENGKFEYRSGIEEIPERAAYVFDFLGEEKVWEKAIVDKAKLAVVRIGGSIEENVYRRLGKLDFNWRVIRGMEVYGPGMEEEGFLARAIRLAAENKELELPARENTLRILAVDDLVEAVMRACFLSGTEKESFLVAGEKITSEEIARVLIDKAKMTRNKVIQKEVEGGLWQVQDSEKDDEVEKTWKKLRWKPEVEFKTGIVETLQYFLNKIDRESRVRVKNKKSEGKTLSLGYARDKLAQDLKQERKGWEVTIEEDEPILPFSFVQGKLAQDLEIEKEEVDEIVEEETESVGEPIDFREEIKQFKLKRFEPEEIKEEIKEKVEIVEKKKEGGKWWWYGVAGILGVMVVVLALIFGWLRIGWVVKGNIEKTVKLVSDRKYVEAEKLIAESSNKLKKLDSNFDERGLNNYSIFRKYQTVVRVMEGVLEVESGAVKLAKTGEIISKAVFLDEEIDWKKETGNLEVGLREMGEKTAILQARLKGDWGWLPARWKQWPVKGVSQLEEVRGVIETSEKMVKMLPGFLGLDGKRRDYMLLLQNEMELRATGGFIGSYGILSFEGGKLLNLEINDVYEADGQLKGHVEPPEEIKKYLGEAGYFMRDANFRVDFGEASKDIKWFLNKETGRNVDGVIGVNLAVAKGILGVIGEVYVPDFKTKINKDNLFDQAEFYAETKFFPGSTQKANFLGGLGKMLLEEIKNLPAEKQYQLYKGMLGLLDKNEIQLALNDKDLAKMMAELGWSGSLYEGKCAQERCLADYFYAVESNFGVNKANYFLYRNIEQSIDISQNTVSRAVKINYENRSKSRDWPGGDYKNYLRVYLPAGVSLVEVSSTEEGGGKKVYSGEELKVRTVGGKKEVGFLVMVPVQKKVTVELKYLSQITLGDKFSYLLYVQRQSGYGDTGLVTLVSFSEGWQPTQVQPAASMVGGKVLFNQKLEKDIRMGVEIGK